MPKAVSAEQHGLKPVTVVSVSNTICQVPYIVQHVNEFLSI